MEKRIQIDGKEVGFRASALTPRLYRHKIGRDMIQDLNKLQKAYTKALQGIHAKKPAEDAPAEEREAYEALVHESQLDVTDLEIFENAAYIMARQYDANIPDTPEGWLDGFETFSIYEVLPAILELWAINAQTTWVKYWMPVRSVIDGAADQKTERQAKIAKLKIQRLAP